MDYKIIWSPDVIDDINAICSYIARDSLYYAESVADKFFEAAQNLVTFPFMGRVVPEYGKKSIRELFIYLYRLIYEISEKEINIVTIIHGKRSLENI